MTTENTKKPEKLQPSRTETFILLSITGLYLVFEVAFGARLLDVVGATTDIHDIEQIEKSGRVISGIAIMILLWSFFVFPYIRKLHAKQHPRLFSKGLFALLLTAGISLFVSYQLQQGILNYIEDRSTAEQRQAATSLTLMSGSVQDELATLKGLDFDVVGINEPETKTFLAMLPALALSIDNLNQKTEETVLDLLSTQAQKRIGSPKEIFQDAYWPSYEAMMNAYNEVYLVASEKHANAIANIPQEQRKSWAEYRKSLGPYENRLVPTNRYSSVRLRVRRQGIPVSNNWNPDDRDGFDAAVSRGIRDRVTPEYNRAMREAFGTELPDDLTATQFFKHPKIQEKWRKEAEMPDFVTLEPAMKFKTFIKEVYKPIIKDAVNERKGTYIADLETFDKGGVNYDEGVDAIRVAYIPVVAFVFSLVGAVAHSIKTMGFFAQFLFGKQTRFRRTLVNLSKVAILFFVINTATTIADASNPVTESELYASLNKQTVEKGYDNYAVLIKSVVQMQPYVYPVAEHLRTYWLGGITFDFDPNTTTPLFAG